MKNKLFLVALATVTVLGPSLATPHHQTVHAAEQAKEPQTSSMTRVLTMDLYALAGIVYQKETV
ncbi:TPA: SpoV family signaling peptide [Streptococcus pyogenes]